jgi:hypothetical protein
MANSSRLLTCRRVTLAEELSQFPCICRALQAAARKIRAMEPRSAGQMLNGRWSAPAVGSCVLHARLERCRNTGTPSPPTYVPGFERTANLQIGKNLSVENTGTPSTLNIKSTPESAAGKGVCWRITSTAKMLCLSPPVFWCSYNPLDRKISAVGYFSELCRVHRQRHPLMNVFLMTRISVYRLLGRSSSCWRSVQLFKRLTG